MTGHWNPAVKVGIEDDQPERLIAALQQAADNGIGDRVIPA